MHFHVQEMIHHYGYVGVFLVLCTEMVGIPFPAETTLTVSGFEWTKGVFSLFPLLVCAAIGNVAGSTIAFCIGRFLGRPVILKFGRYVGITESRLVAAETRFVKYRTSIVLFAKFIAGVRVLVPYLAGINRMPFGLFTVYNTASALAWSAFFIVVGRYAGVLWTRYHAMLGPFLWPLVAIIACVGLLVYWWVHKKNKLH